MAEHLDEWGELASEATTLAGWAWRHRKVIREALEWAIWFYQLSQTHG